MQNWFGYSDPAMEEALYETTSLRGVSLDIENYCTLRCFFVPLGCGRA